MPPDTPGRPSSVRSSNRSQHLPDIPLSSQPGTRLLSSRCPFKSPRPCTGRLHSPWPLMAYSGATALGAAQSTQPAQQPAAVAPPQPQMATPTQPQPQGYRLQPLPAVTETEAPQSDVSQYPSSAPRRGWVLPVVAVSVLALGLVGGALGGHWLWPGKSAEAPSSPAAAAPAANKPATLRAGSGSFVCSSGGTGVSCWGADAQANTQGARVSPTAVPGLEKVKVSALSVGKGFAVAVDDSGKVYAWGANEVGQLGKKTDEALVNQAVEAGRSHRARLRLRAHLCARQGHGLVLRLQPLRTGQRICLRHPIRAGEGGQDRRGHPDRHLRL